MANENVSQDNSLKHTKILPSGTRIRAAKQGETYEQMQKWQAKILNRTGCASIVLPSQSIVDTFCARLKAHNQREQFRGHLERQYFAGELVRRPGL